MLHSIAKQVLLDVVENVVLLADPIFWSINIIWRRKENSGSWRLLHTDQVATDETGREEPEENTT